MQDLNDLAYFVKVVDHHGFAPAARALGMQKSKLSRRIAGLEARLGVSLLQRSTRRFSVTEIGQSYYQHCQAMLGEAEAAQQAIEQATAEPMGLVRMACPPGLLTYRIGEAIATFMAAYPKVEIRLKAFNWPADFILEGFDLVVGIREPTLDSSSLTIRKLGEISQCLVAAPALVAALPAVRVPTDLKAFPAIGAGGPPPIADGAGLEWSLTHPEGTVATVSLRSRLVTDDLSALRAAALAGIGVAQMPNLLIANDMRAGTLARVLPEWESPNIPVYAVFPSRRGLLPSVRALLDHLAEECVPYRHGTHAAT